MRSDTGRGLRYYCQGEFLAMGSLAALIVFLLLLALLGGAGGLPSMTETGLSLLVLLPTLLVLLLAAAGGILSLVGLITIRGAHPDYRKALVLALAGIPCQLLSQYSAGALGVLAGLAGSILGLIYTYCVVQATAALLEEWRAAADLPGSAAAFLDRLVQRGWLGWKMRLVAGVANCATTFIQSVRLLRAGPLAGALLPLQTDPLSMGFLVALFALDLAGWWLTMDLLRKGSRLL